MLRRFRCVQSALCVPIYIVYNSTIANFIANCPSSTVVCMYVFIAHSHHITTKFKLCLPKSTDLQQECVFRTGQI